MSWSVAFRDLPSNNAKATKQIEDELARLRASRDVNNVPNSALSGKEVEAQVDAAIDAAQALIESNALGNAKNNTYNVTLAGHANPNNTAPGGVSSDMISVTVTRSNNA